MNQRKRMIAVRLALADCSVGMIARGLLCDMEDVRSTLAAAVAAGELFEVPPDEWAVESPPPRSRYFPVEQIMEIAHQVEASFPLSPHEAMLVAALLTEKILDRELVAAIHPGMTSRTLKVHMSRIRPVLRQFAHAEIETLHGVGYRMSEGNRERVRGALANAEAA